MKKTLFLILSIFYGISTRTLAQDTIMKKAQIEKATTSDTIYYFLDTAKVPPNDRIVKFKNNRPFREYYIFCSCMDTKEKYILLVGLENKGVMIDDKKFKSLKLIKLLDLIPFVKSNTPRFGKHVVYIIEPLKKQQYVAYKVVNSSYGITGTVE